MTSKRARIERRSLTLGGAAALVAAMAATGCGSTGGSGNGFPDSGGLLPRDASATDATIHRGKPTPDSGTAANDASPGTDARPGTDASGPFDAGAPDTASPGDAGWAFTADASAVDAGCTGTAPLGAACLRDSDCICGAICAASKGAVLCIPGPGCNQAILRWDSPTANADGTCLTDLGGFDILWGQTTGGPYPYTADAGLNCAPTGVQVPCGDAGQTELAQVCEFRLGGLDAGTWYFVAETYTTTGLTSAPSTEASKTVPKCQ